MNEHRLRPINDTDYDIDKFIDKISFENVIFIFVKLSDSSESRIMKLYNDIKYKSSLSFKLIMAQNKTL